MYLHKQLPCRQSLSLCSSVLSRCPALFGNFILCPGLASVATWSEDPGPHSLCPPTPAVSSISCLPWKNEPSSNEPARRGGSPPSNSHGPLAFLTSVSPTQYQASFPQGIGWRIFFVSAQSCLTLCSPVNSIHQAPLSRRFSRQEYWSGLPFPPQRDFTHPRIKPKSLTSPTLAGRFFTTSAIWEAQFGGEERTKLSSHWCLHRQGKSIYDGEQIKCELASSLISSSEK